MDAFEGFHFGNDAVKMVKVFARNADIDEGLKSELLGIDLKNGNSHFSKRNADVGKHGDSVLCDDLHERLVLLILLYTGKLSPLYVDESVFVLFRTLNNMRTVAFVN